VFRVAHSPTVRKLKGTEVFLEVCSRLRAKGIPIEPVLIEKMSHRDALEAKAACDATFDSFWLGIQGSGLEGAAMGQPVVAGDFDACAAYVKHIGSCPYTFANDADSLADQLAALATDAEFYSEEAQRVGAYVREHHDYPAVARRYSEILKSRIPEIAVPDVPELPEREPLITHTPPPVKTPESEPVLTPKPRPPRTPKRKPPETR
jgi:glycosyltransferase involved in cell wall biosynthesis